MPSARAVFWAVLATGATISAVAGFATERWTMSGIDPYYFGVPESGSDHRSSSLPADAINASDASDGSGATSAPDAAPNSTAPEVAGEMAPETAAELDTDRWRRQIDADDRRWQARMDADLQREPRIADPGPESGQVMGGRMDAAERNPTDEKAHVASEAGPASDGDAPIDPDKPA